MGVYKNLVFAQMQDVEKIFEHPQRGSPAYPASPRRKCAEGKILKKGCGEAIAEIHV